MRRYAGLGFLLLLFLGSCATQQLPPIGEAGLLQLEDDEKRLWVRAKEEEEKLNSKDLVYQDLSLLAYMNRVAQGLLPESASRHGLSIRVKVIKNPHMNAFALPHGAIFIHTGFLAKMENEAQLVTVLAHELAHITHRHTVQNVRNTKGAAAFLGTLQVLGAPAGIYGLAPVLLGAVGAMAAVTGYSRELEAEADKVGFGLLVNAGYDQEETIRVFETFIKYAEKEEIKESFFFSTHPRLQERKDSYARLVQENPMRAKGRMETDSFRGAINALLLDNALMDLSMGRFDLAREAVEKFLQREPKNTRALYFLGEVYRKRGEEKDIPQAKEKYQLAIEQDPFYPDPYKGLGLIYLKQGEREKTKETLERYLELAPKAEDKTYIEEYLKGIGKN